MAVHKDPGCEALGGQVLAAHKDPGYEALGGQVLAAHKDPGYEARVAIYNAIYSEALLQCDPETVHL